ETGNGTHLYTVGELASATFVGDDMRHGIVSLRLREEPALNPRLNQGCPLGQFLSQYQTKPVAADVHGRSETESQRKRCRYSRSRSTTEITSTDASPGDSRV